MRLLLSAPLFLVSASLHAVPRVVELYHDVPDPYGDELKHLPRYQKGAKRIQSMLGKDFEVITHIPNVRHLSFHAQELLKTEGEIELRFGMFNGKPLPPAEEIQQFIATKKLGPDLAIVMVQSDAPWTELSKKSRQTTTTTDLKVFQQIPESCHYESYYKEIRCRYARPIMVTSFYVEKVKASEGISLSGCELIQFMPGTPVLTNCLEHTSFSYRELPQSRREKKRLKDELVQAVAE
jgi:hypothetical protein